MDYKYYTAVCYGTQEQALAFSQNCLATQTGNDTQTRYMYPVGLTETGNYAVVVYDINTLSESDISRVTIEKVNTDFIQEQQ